ncbi:MAG: hypothetical protein DHS20C21_06880 [Gemmatimonadota bacterium]|nr:MAG: hypothetical protein DHS20C21_06880 [Gemmatimonadota bacterium]
MKRFRTFFLATGSALFLGCAGIGPTTFLHETFDFGFVETVAVIPFENLSSDQGAGYRATRFFVTELLAAEAFDVVEPGEVARALEKQGLVRVAELTEAQAVAIGKEVGAQALVLGTIGESATIRSGTSSVNVVTLVVRMVETEQGVTVWSTSHTEGGRGFWATLLGLGNRSQGEVTRRCVEKTVRTLIQ